MGYVFVLQKEDCNWTNEPTESVLGSIYAVFPSLYTFDFVHFTHSLFFASIRALSYAQICARTSALSFIYINLFVVYLIFNEFQSARVHVHILFGAKTEQRRTRANVKKRRKKTAQAIWVYGLVFAMKQIYGYFLFCVCNKKKSAGCIMSMWRASIKRRKDMWVFLCSHVCVYVSVTRCVDLQFVYMFAFIYLRLFHSNISFCDVLLFLIMFAARSFFIHFLLLLLLLFSNWLIFFRSAAPESTKKKTSTKRNKWRKNNSKKRSIADTITTTMANDTAAKNRKTVQTLIN